MNVTLPSRAIAAWYIIANIEVQMIQHMVERSNRHDANRDEPEFNQDAADNADGWANANY